MTERRKDLLALALMLGILILFFSKILFTDKIIRAPDIINEYYWLVLDFSKKHLLDLVRFDLRPDWDIFANSGNTLEGGGVGSRFQFLQLLVYYFIAPPASVAWHIMLHLFFGGCGTYFFCRCIGASRPAAFLGGLIFAVAPENASLINAGHVMKVATISVAPWAFFVFEKGLQSRRLIWFLATGFVLAFQFFYTHWQIAFYTCLGVGVYGVVRTAGILAAERGGFKGVSRLIGLNLVTMLFFLSTVAISLAPLASWSVESNRGAQSGANQGKGGLQVEEAMSWSMPPEELATFVIPGFFGYSRQEGGENPTNIASYYWGRMHFTQTNDYMGLLPWLLLPLPLLFRRDRYTCLALFAVAGGILFSLGKYSVVYQFLFDYFPGIDRFRVPKMMMFMPLLGLAVLAARGLDIMMDDEVRKSRKFLGYVLGLLAVPLLLLVVLGIARAGQEGWVARFYGILSEPTRYEQGAQLVLQRWNNLITETGIALAVASVHVLAIIAFWRRWLPAKALPFVLVALFLADVGRVDAKFMFLVDVPQKSTGAKTPVMEFLARDSKEYRVLPADGSDPMHYASNKIPVMFTSYPVQQRRWQEFLDAFSFTSGMPDMLNVKYLVYAADQYQRDRSQLGDKFVPVFTSPDGSEVVLQNRAVFPKGWLVPAVAVVKDPQQALAILQNPGVDLRGVAVVETQPTIPMADPNAPPAGPVGEVRITRYEGEEIRAIATARTNALLVLGEKYYRGWKARVDGRETVIYPVNHVLRGVYLSPGNHEVEFLFDPLPFKVGKYLTLSSFALFAVMLGRELWLRRRSARNSG